MPLRHDRTIRTYHGTGIEAVLDPESVKDALTTKMGYSESCTLLEILLPDLSLLSA